MIAASAAMRTGKPNLSTMGPPTSGPTKAPMGFAPFTIPNANATRPAGARSAMVARMRPVLPRPSDWIARASAKTHTFGARAVRDSATNAATNERMMRGMGPGRYGRAHQNGKKGWPAKFENEVMAPIQKATAASSMPRRGRYSGVNAFTCPYAVTSKNPAMAKRTVMRTQPEIGRIFMGFRRIRGGSKLGTSGDAELNRECGGRHVLEPHLQDREGEALRRRARTDQLPELRGRVPR